MEKRYFDFVYLTNTPSFYKLNLCEAIARNGTKILIVLYGYGAEAVNEELSDRSKWSFDFEFINYGDSNSRNKLLTFISLCKLMRNVEAKKLLYSGWLALEYNLFSFLSPKKKNVVVCESSEIDVDFSGVKGLLKKLIIKRMSAALPSGLPHDRLFFNIGFKGPRNITGSVGIFHKPKKRIKPTSISGLKFIYVGRLIPVKNVEFLIDVFNRNGFPLTIVGSGRGEDKLKAKANSNIQFVGFIENNKLGEIYQQHDIFILPSVSETWGLVVEEALYWGLPVIVSSRVGSGEDMVKNLGTGEIFESGNQQSLQAAIETVSSNYEKYRKAVDSIDWQQRDKNQVEAYLKLLDK